MTASSSTPVNSRPAFASLVRRALAPASAWLLIAAPAAARAPSPCPVGHALDLRADWEPPLDRIVSMHATETSLRDALDRLSAATRVRFSYSAEALPLDRKVCLAAEGAPLGRVLERLLVDASARIVSVSADHVVLAPLEPTRPSMMVAPVVLDRIVVTGNNAGASQRGLPLALDVLDGHELERRRQLFMSSAFGGSAPGVWIWGQSPGSLLLRYGSIRGASSFGLSYPKTFIDGIEVANPLLVTRIVPEAIDRIELIRGPHGAALYGADAISGVMNVSTRLERPRDGAPALSLRSQAGLMGGDFAPNPALTTAHTLTINAGKGTRALRFSAEAGTDGDYVPNAYARRLTLAASGRSVAARTILTGTLRFFGQQARSPISPILVDSVVPDSGGRRLIDRSQRQQVMQYTAGTTLKILASERWRHTLTAGLDGYTLDGIFDDGAPIPSAADSALKAARGEATRTTLRWSSMARIVSQPSFTTDITIAADHSLLRQHTTTLAPSGPGGPGPGGGPVPLAGLTRWRNTAGVGALGNAAFSERLFLHGGLRLERSTGVTGTVTLPMLGAAFIPVTGPLTLKLRGAYGKGIRWPETPIRETLQGRIRVNPSALALEPEEQSGIEGGLDLIWARGLSFTVTRFDQTASGLIQRVLIPGDTGGSGPRDRVRYQLQNVGAIANKGWEMQGTASRGALSLTAAFSLVDSRVERLATGYAGDLQPGDRMLEVPRRTMSLSASWAGSPWYASITAWRAEDWVNYDRLRLAADFAADTSATPARFTGAALRTYWRRYDGSTHIAAALSYPFNSRFTLSLTGENLLDRQRGEPDNITVLPGRTFGLGVRGEF